MSTNTALAVQEKSLTVAPSYSSEQIKLLADTIAKGCDENELRLFIEIAKLKRLDPFSGQIRPVKRWNSDLGRDAMNHDVPQADGKIMRDLADAIHKALNP